MAVVSSKRQFLTSVTTSYHAYCSVVRTGAPDRAAVESGEFDACKDEHSLTLLQQRSFLTGTRIIIAGELFQCCALNQPGVGKLPCGELACADQTSHRLRVNIEAFCCLCHCHIILKAIAVIAHALFLLLLYDATPSRSIKGLGYMSSAVED